MRAETPAARRHRFSFHRGPLHRLGSRLGLVRGGSNTLAMGLVLGPLLWAVTVVLALLAGHGEDLFTLTKLAGHVRLLAAIPLFFLAETLVEPRMEAFLDTLVRSEVVPPEAVGVLESELDRAHRAKRSWLPEGACLVVAVLFSLLSPYLHLSGETEAYDPAQVPGMSTGGIWYWAVCMTVYRFLLFRWLWWLALWSYLLLRLATRVKLHLVASHPDRAAGLGYLETVQTHFAPLIVAHSAVQAASFAERFAAGALALDAVYPAVALILVADAVLFVGPLFIFSPQLWACRVKAWCDYRVLAAIYVNAFERKWMSTDDAPKHDEMLGSADMQSLADLGGSVDLVLGMRLVPLTTRTLIVFALAAVLPLAPLLLLKYPIAELTHRLLMRLVGA